MPARTRVLRKCDSQGTRQVLFGLRSSVRLEKYLAAYQASKVAEEPVSDQILLFIFADAFVFISLITSQKASMHLDCTKLGLFLMCFNTAYKLVLCLMRRLVTKNDRINAPVAGFLSALSLALDSDSRRELFMVLTMSRAIESTLKIGEEKGAIPKL